MSENAFAKFVSADCAWIHDALAIAEGIFGVSDIDVDTDDEDNLVVTVTTDPDSAAA